MLISIFLHCLCLEPTSLFHLQEISNKCIYTQLIKISENTYSSEAPSHLVQPSLHLIVNLKTTWMIPFCSCSPNAFCTKPVCSVRNRTDFDLNNFSVTTCYISCKALYQIMFLVLRTSLKCL